MQGPVVGCIFTDVGVELLITQALLLLEHRQADRHTHRQTDRQTHKLTDAFDDMTPASVISKLIK